ncbi:MAG: 2,3-epoxybenzoyl-CoA dihydrolase, partial [Jatrophihabitantaceae bacterium]
MSTTTTGGTTTDPAAAGAPDTRGTAASVRVEFDTSPERYKHWKLTIDGEVATLTLSVDVDGGIVPGYELKMNSYDLGVDIEL